MTVKTLIFNNLEVIQTLSEITLGVTIVLLLSLLLTTIKTKN